MDKGARVTITGGKGKGVAGAVFWKGANKWGPGDRYGVHGDDGETYWVAEDDLEAGGEPAPVVEAGPEFQKGDRVSFTERGEPGTGTVFWIGQSKAGPGQRLGIRDDQSDDAVWKDARHVKPLDASADPIAADAGSSPVHLESPDGYEDIPWEDPLSVDELPPSAPWDDGAVAAVAADEDEVPPWEP